MAEYRGYVGLDVHKDTIAAAVAWPGRVDPEYRGSFPNRSSSRQLVGFLGLAPGEYSSGSRRRQGAITKTGNGHVRRLLTEAAWAYRFPARRRPICVARQPRSRTGCRRSPGARRNVCAPGM